MTKKYPVKIFVSVLEEKFNKMFSNQLNFL